MRDWSLHLLDLAENSLRAGAGLVSLGVRLEEDGRLFLTLLDDGCGMTPELLREAVSPFATTRSTRKVGMGLALAGQNAERAGGALRVSSAPGQGTAVEIEADTRSIDCLPLGDLAQTLFSLICMNPLRPDFEWRLCSPRGEQHFDTREVRQALGEGISLGEPEVREYLDSLLTEQCETVFGGIMQ